MYIYEQEGEVFAWFLIFLGALVIYWIYCFVKHYKSTKTVEMLEVNELSKNESSEEIITQPCVTHLIHLSNTHIQWFDDSSDYTLYDGVVQIGEDGQALGVITNQGKFFPLNIFTKPQQDRINFALLNNKDDYCSELIKDYWNSINSRIRNERTAPFRYKNEPLKSATEYKGEK